MGRVFFNTRLNLQDIAAAYTVLPGDSGKTFMVNQASAFAIDSPNAATALDGFRSALIVGTLGAHAVTINATTADGDSMHGHGIDGEDGAAQTVSEGTGFDVVTLASGATKGDRVQLVSDGTSWYVFSLAADKAHITFT